METKKLYKFLLVEPKILKADPDFIDFRVLYRSEEEKLYRMLFSKYAMALTVLGYYKHHFSERIETIGEDRKELLDRRNKKKTELDEFIKSSGEKVDQNELKALLRTWTGKAEPQDKRRAEPIQKDKEMLAYAESIMKQQIEIFMDTYLANELANDTAPYHMALQYIEIIEKAFYKSYGFFAKPEGDTVLCNEEELINQLNFIYLHNIHEKGKWADGVAPEPVKEESGEYMQVAEGLNKRLGISDVTIGQRDLTDWLVIDTIERFVEPKNDEPKNDEPKNDEPKNDETDEDGMDDDETDYDGTNFIDPDDYRKQNDKANDEKSIKRYLDDEALKTMRTKNEDVVSIAEEITAGLDKGLAELVAYIKSGKYDGLEDSGKKFIMDEYVRLIKMYMAKIKKSRDGYFRAFALGDVEYERISGYYDKMKDCVRAYDSFRNSPNERIKTERQRQKIKEEMAENKENRNKVFGEMYKILEDIQALRRNSLEKAFKRLYRASKVQARLEDAGIKDADLRLYKKLFKRLEENIMKEVAIAYPGKVMPGYVGASKPKGTGQGGLNGMYVYGDMGILTLTFYNTSIRKYKTAAVIVDAEDFAWIAIKSEKSAWTFKGGKEKNKSIYGHRAYEPDRIVTDNGKVRLAEHIMKVDPKETECFLKSHKFDFRKSNIGVGKEEGKAWKKAGKEKYYPGEIWIGDIKDNGDGEDNKGKKLDAETTVCVNGEDNEKGASIIYFDDSESLKDFLVSI